MFSGFMVGTWWAASIVAVVAGLSLFLSWSTQYEPEIFGLLFGQVLGVDRGNLAPIAALAAVCVLMVLLLFRRLLLASVLPDLADADRSGKRWLRSGPFELVFLVMLALATTLTLPVVGALLIFSLMIGPPSAARSLTANPRAALGLSVAIALVTVWLSIAGAYCWNLPVGFFVGVLSAACYALGRGWAHCRPPRRSRGE